MQENHPNFTIVDQSLDKVFSFTTNIDVQLEQCQYMTRISYRYEDKETNTSPREFVQSLINSRHYEPLEFVSLYVDLHRWSAQKDERYYTMRNFILERSANPKDSHVRCLDGCFYALTLREVVEWWDQYERAKFSNEPLNISKEYDGVFNKICKCIIGDRELKELFEKHPDVMKRGARVKWIVTTNRQIATEISRHRSLSKNWESTRHCDYSKERFNGLKICAPTLYDECIHERLTPEHKDIINAISYMADNYMDAVNKGEKVQAAYLLPSCTAVKVAFAGFMDDVDRVIEMRTTNYCGIPHQDANALMRMVDFGLKSNPPYSHTLKDDDDSLRSLEIECGKTWNDVCTKVLDFIGGVDDDDVKNVLNAFGTHILNKSINNDNQSNQEDDGQCNDKQQSSSNQEDEEDTDIVTLLNLLLGESYKR